MDGEPVLAPAPLGLALADGRVLGRGRVERVDRREIDETIPTPFGKRATVRNACRELALVFADGATLRARAYDDGFALRWETALPGRIRVRDEDFASPSPRSRRASSFRPGRAPRLRGALAPRADLGARVLGRAACTASLPLVFEPPAAPKLALLQADLDDYPAMYLGYRSSHPRQLSRRLPAAGPARGAGRLPGLRPGGDRARRRHRRDRGHAHLPVAGVRPRPPRRRSPRERHGHPPRSPCPPPAPTSRGSSRARSSGTTGPTGTSRASTSRPAATTRRSATTSTSPRGTASST